MTTKSLTEFFLEHAWHEIRVAQPIETKGHS